MLRWISLPQKQITTQGLDVRQDNVTMSLTVFYFGSRQPGFRPSYNGVQETLHKSAWWARLLTSCDDRAVWTLKIEFGNRSSSFSPANKLRALTSRPSRIKILKNVPPLPNCCRVCLLSVVVEFKDIHVTCMR
jgi:hypothetical protein